MLSSYEKLFGHPPNISKLRVFGCLCYPWLRPYSAHKLEPRSSPCVSVGYFLTQSAYLCLDPATQRLYTSRHVDFVEYDFPFPKLSASSSPPVPVPIPPDSSIPAPPLWCLSPLS